MAVNTLGFSLVLPYLSVYLHSARGVPMSIVGAIYAVAGVAGAAGMVVGGELSDRRGPRAVMLSALLLRALNLGLLGALLFLGAPWWLVGALVVTNALLRAVFTPACNAAAAAVGGAVDRMRAFGWQRIGVNAGWAIGPALGGVLAEVDYAAMFLAAVPLTLGSVWLAAKVRLEERPAPVGFHVTDLLPARSDRLLWGFLLAATLHYALTTQLVTTLPVFAHEVGGLPKSEVGIIFMVNGVLVVAFQAAGTRAAERLGVRGALLLGPVLYAVGYLSMGALPGLAGILAGISVVTLGEVISGPALLSAAVGLAPPDRTGRVLGWLGFANAVGVSLGAASGGFALDAWKGEPILVWAVLGASGLAAGVLFSRLLKSRAVEVRRGAAPQAEV
jgi:predicted MFS family arabinose efflux permease